MILAIFLPLVLVSYLVTNFGIKKTYASSTTIANNAAISQAAYSAIQLAMNSDEVKTTVTTNLAAVKHADGSAIAKSELSFSFSTFASNMITFNITFSSRDNTIIQRVLTEYTTVALETTKASYPNLSVYTPASNPVKTSKENRYFLIGVAASVVLALGIPFIWEIVADQVYETKDLELLGVDGFEVYSSGK